MAKKNKQKKKVLPSQLSGLSVYQDGKRTVYAPFFTSKGYIINEDNGQHYVSYIQSYLITLLIFSVSYIITKNLLVSAGLAVFFMIGNVINFYMTFLKKAPVIDPYKKPAKDNFAVRQAKSLEVKNIVTIIVCCPILAAVLLLNGYVNKFEGFAAYLNWFTAGCALFYGLLHVYILIYKKKNL